MVNNTAQGKTVYLASGWFNAEQERRVKEAEIFLRDMGFIVFSPREHQVKEIPFGSQEWRDLVFANDVRNVKDSDFIFGIYDQTDPGTMWELGYAYSFNKPIFIYHEAKEYVNLMISDSLTAYFKNWYDVLHYDFDKRPKIRYEGEIE